MSNTEKIILIIGLAVIVYYGYTKFEDIKENIEEKLDFF